MTISPSDIKIKLKLLKSATVLAQVSVVFFEVIETHGWKVLNSTKVHPIFNEEIWIQPPSYKNFSGWKEVVYINDRELFDAIQCKIYDSYQFAKGKEGVKATESGTIRGGVIDFKPGSIEGGNELSKEDYEAIEKIQF